MLRMRGEAVAMFIPPGKWVHTWGPDRLDLKFTCNLMCINKYLIPTYPPKFVYSQGELEVMEELIIQHAHALADSGTLTNARFLHNLRVADDTQSVSTWEDSEMEDAEYMEQAGVEDEGEEDGVEYLDGYEEAEEGL